MPVRLVGSPEDRAALQNALRDAGIAFKDGPEGPELEPAALAAFLSEKRDLRTLFELTRDFASSSDLGSLLFDMVQRLAGELEVERCALVLIDERQAQGYVVAASDNRGIVDLRIDLHHYPEINEVVQKNAPLVLGDAPRHPLLDPVRKAIAAAGVSALAVFPVTLERHVLGVLILRAKGRTGFTPREVQFVATAAQATAVALRNARMMETARSEAAREMAARLAAERRVRDLERYAEFFSHVADGICILDEQGSILHLNPAGAQILGVSASEARGLRVQDLAAPEDALAAVLLLREVERGGRVVSAELKVKLRDGRRLTLSLGAGKLRVTAGAAVLSFRDVTEQRTLQDELRKTKDFLERLVESAVDAIIAADMRGTILLFNRAAQRVLGFAADEVIGKRSVAELYPKGVASEVMRRLRAPADGGPGRLELMRTEVVSKGGERIPVNLSAVILYELGKEAATVGIFADLRERLAVERDLARAQVTAELAGAAAHELNQPLTAVMGHAELLLKRAPEGPQRAALEAIFRESERLAEIVRKIGKITRYETKPYVGEARIVDLDRAGD
jgi:PAS domain S-box-containing protein